jgi:hypothetical protein
MTLHIKLNLDNIYRLNPKPGLDYFVFNTIVKGGKKVPIVVIIRPPVDELMPDVYEISYGPVDRHQKIDDSAELDHVNPSKVFSTLAFAGLLFLSEHPGAYLGINAFDPQRACLYHRFVRGNYDYLAHYFQISGMHFEAKGNLLKDADVSKATETNDTVHVPQKIDDAKMNPKNLFNYYLFKLNKS